MCVDNVTQRMEFTLNSQILRLIIPHKIISEYVKRTEGWYLVLKGSLSPYLFSYLKYAKVMDQDPIGLGYSIARRYNSPWSRDPYYNESENSQVYIAPALSCSPYIGYIACPLPRALGNICQHLFSPQLSSGQLPNTLPPPHKYRMEIDFPKARAGIYI